MELEMNNDIFIKVSELLENGAKERDHDFHIMTFCTIGKEGVEARSVVLRNFDKDKNIIRFHTDYRSPKLDDIKKNPNTVCLVYSYNLKTQLRIRQFLVSITTILFGMIHGIRQGSHQENVI